MGESTPETAAVPETAAPEPAGIDAGQILAIGEEHRRGQHRIDRHPACSRCQVEQLLDPRRPLPAD